MTPTEAIALFDTRARAYLGTVPGLKGTQADVQRAIGVASPVYAAYLTGRRASWGVLLDWLQRWHRAGHPSLGILAEIGASVEGQSSVAP